LRIKIQQEKVDPSTVRIVKIRKEEYNNSMSKANTAADKNRSMHYAPAVKRLKTILKKGVSVGLVYVDFSKTCHIEDKDCWKRLEKLLIKLDQYLLKMKDKEFPHLDFFSARLIKGDDLMFFFIPTASSHLHWTEGLLSKMASLIRDSLSNCAKIYHEDQWETPVEFLLGWSSINSVRGILPERLIYRAVREASDLTADSRFSEIAMLARELERVIDLVQFRTVFQPVVSLKTTEVMGYEALARGPNNTPFENPDFIFNIASKGRLLLKAERLAKLSAMELSRDIPQKYKLFLNIESELLVKPEEILIMLREVGCRPGRIVFEITERKAVKDFEHLRSVVKLLRDEGYEFAIDDAGSGYASMESIAILDPHYIKIDQSIIRGIDGNKAKQDVVKAFINLSRRRHALLIAEGIEQAKECRLLKSLGIHYGQGYLFAHPGFPPPLLPNGNNRESKLAHSIR